MFCLRHPPLRPTSPGRGADGPRRGSHRRSRPSCHWPELCATPAFWMRTSNRAEVEDAVAHAADAPCRSRCVCACSVAPAERQRRLAGAGNRIEVAGADLGRAEPVPPGANEAAPGSALAVGRLHHLVEVAEEAVDAGDLEHAADDLRPVLVAADGAACRAAGPAAIQAWQSVRQAATSRARLARTQVIRSGWRKPRALPGPLDIGVEPDAHEPPRHLVGELRVVAGGDPEAADRQPRHLGLRRGCGPPRTAR